ncbi:sigma-54-dependent transcriptional regulator [Planctobacterium marinum]|uniref:sigma-54-dependent transcriptional regulator n=1 Tax=Planctobacterium marinum TaxID=1631968 RepID=UPI001E292114|nr:sigma-54 dependent transcriptional regulator [Planctobacterium marinum]MCC2605189.1 sigma-54 dependent transcriptional regulator [Planctobacterium marinum]
MKARVLVIDDNADVAKAIGVLLHLNDIDTHHAATAKAGLEALNSSPFDLVIQDMNFSKNHTSGEEGIQLFQQIRDNFSDIPIILITAWTSLETAVQLVKSGASDYLSKPWDDDKLLVTINNLLELAQLQQAHRQHTLERIRQRDSLSEQFDLCGIRYQSDAMAQLLRMTTQVANSDVAVLITGPNGAGKEKIAEVLQANSPCKDGPFIKVNVGALTPELMAAELFGAEAGAYTGITQRRQGRFESAHGGTLFLDEIGNLSMDGQIKLLRVLETGEFQRIGGNEDIKVKVRIISATNSDLSAAIAAGTFREDLYYRLNVIELNLPPLHKRKADILPLAELFLANKATLSEEAVMALKQYHWPGNVREVKNVMQRAALLCQNQLIKVSDLGLELQQPLKIDASKDDEINANDIRRAIDEAGGVISDAARLLGLGRSALYRRMKKFGIDEN